VFAGMLFVGALAATRGTASSGSTTSIKRWCA
jgi:hypothetical protein